MENLLNYNSVLNISSVEEISSLLFIHEAIVNKIKMNNTEKDKISSKNPSKILETKIIKTPATTKSTVSLLKTPLKR